MPPDPARRVKRERTSQERARHRAIREEFRDKPSLTELLAANTISKETFARARKMMSEGPASRSDDQERLSQFLCALKQERERQGLTLAEVAERSGIDSGALSRLESCQNVNPTVTTLARYAQAVGKRITWGFEDLPAPKSAEG
jgi:hypothetical protein